MWKTDAPSSIFFKEEYEEHTTTLSACISALMAARETDRVNVIRLEHIKYTSGFLHEAILVELQEVDPDVAEPRKTYALIDRDIGQRPARKPFFSSSSSFSSNKARDAVKISRDKRLFSISCQYKVRQYIEFNAHPWPFIKLLVVATSVAETKPEYNVISGQCYWYASSIWDVVILHLRKVWPEWEQATGGVVSAKGRAREMFTKFEGAWTKREAEIKELQKAQRQKEYRAAYVEGLSKGRKESVQEKEGLQRKIDGLEARLKALEAQQEKYQLKRGFHGLWFYPWRSRSE
ncbi:uncharacterized protein BT62DRAFT_933015 [Guyanagaster necrorhizus]|uniref:Uncharacterized protein n=1 Tax=Guyanagaster necrorhizus TaxID=856835 RepID=A0A9P7VSK9_9AGAR|nr:uncharacterized protein BT62DRAFT_933015 [Guyanagaster necrorhizus MCA 3950]KAG7445211.1 hypothetical protein BT62DRAFT_933015 [Guyanagaster necrorhizus MCA 3950]